MDIGIIGGVITLPAFEDAFGYAKLGKKGAALADANLSANIVSVMQAGAFAGALVRIQSTPEGGDRGCTD